MERVRGTAPHDHPFFPRDPSNTPVPTSPLYHPQPEAAESCNPHGGMKTVLEHPHHSHLSGGGTSKDHPKQGWHPLH